MKTTGERQSWDTPCAGGKGRMSCTTGLGDAICKVCKRTAEEVIHWNSYSREKKIEINQKRLKRK